MSNNKDMQIKEYTLITSNVEKYQEYQSYGLTNLNIGRVNHLKEILSEDPKEVAFYKALDAGVGYIVEDTSLFVDGVDIGTNIKWLLDNLDSHVGKSCTWLVAIAKNTGVAIEIFYGTVSGTLVKKTHAESFGFDDNFLTPLGVTLHELLITGRKNEFSARKDAVSKLINETPDEVFNNLEAFSWQGKYQD